MKTQKSIITNLLLVLIILISYQSYSQNPIGRLHDQKRNSSYLLYPNGIFVQIGNPKNRMQSMREPTGQMYASLPSSTPHINGFFIDWNNNLVEVNRYNGTNIIGYCECPLPVNPYQNIYKAPTFNNNTGISTNNGFRKIPVEIVRNNQSYGRPITSSQAQAQECYEYAYNSSTGAVDKDKFTDCLITKMASSQELEIYECINNSSSDEERLLCLFGKLGGSKEQKIANKLLECYDNFGTDYTKYTLCMSDEFTEDEDIKKVIACMEQQSKTGDISFYGTALCYGLNNFDLNAESQIMIECGMASRGEPYSFATCSGGRLLTREIDKCFKYGVGGSNGCFGKNNDIVKGLKKIGDILKVDLGKNNKLTINWNNAVNDLMNGPSKNNEVVKTLQNLSNEASNLSKNVEREINNVLPKITF